MENLFDIANQDETQPVEAAQAAATRETVETVVTTQPLAEVESETPAVLKVIEEIDTAPKAQVAKTLLGKPVPHKREEPPPNPLLLDPYEWDVR